MGPPVRGMETLLKPEKCLSEFGQFGVAVLPRLTKTLKADESFYYHALETSTKIKNYAVIEKRILVMIACKRVADQGPFYQRVLNQFKR